MVTFHSKMLLSSTRPAEKPSTGFFARSEQKNRKRKKVVSRKKTPNQKLENATSKNHKAIGLKDQNAYRGVAFATGGLPGSLPSSRKRRDGSTKEKDYHRRIGSLI